MDCIPFKIPQSASQIIHETSDEKSSGSIQIKKKKLNDLPVVDELKGGAISKPKLAEIKPASGVPEPTKKMEIPTREIAPAHVPYRVPDLIYKTEQPGTHLFADVISAEQSLVSTLAARCSGKGAHYDAPDVRHAIAHSLQKHPRLLNAYFSSSST